MKKIFSFIKSNIPELILLIGIFLSIYYLLIPAKTVVPCLWLPGLPKDCEGIKYYFYKEKAGAITAAIFGIILLIKKYLKK